MALRPPSTSLPSQEASRRAVPAPARAHDAPPNEAGGTFECSKDKGKDFKPCTSPYKKNYKRGKHTFKVRAIDAAGNVDGSAASDTGR